MGLRNSKTKTDYILDVNWDITESPDKNLFIKLPNNITTMHILCPIRTKELNIEILKLKAKNTCNVIPYLDIFKGIYNIYRHHRYKIIRYAEENNLPIEIYFKQLVFKDAKNKVGTYNLKLTD